MSWTTSDHTPNCTSFKILQRVGFDLAQWVLLFDHLSSHDVVRTRWSLRSQLITKGKLQQKSKEIGSRQKKKLAGERGSHRVAEAPPACCWSCRCHPPTAAHSGSSASLRLSPLIRALLCPSYSKGKYMEHYEESMKNCVNLKWYKSGSSCSWQ